MRKRKTFTLVEVMIVVVIISILAAIAIPNLLRQRVTANEVGAQATLKTISSACETYAASNAGNYPTLIADLVNGIPSYINEDYTFNSRYGYGFNCTQLEQTGYTCTARPVTCNSTGSKTFTITTGGVFTNTGC